MTTTVQDNIQAIERWKEFIYGKVHMVRAIEILPNLADYVSVGVVFEKDVIEFLESYSRELRNDTIEECLEKIRGEGRRYNNSKLPLRYEECIVLLDQLKQKG